MQSINQHEHCIETARTIQIRHPSHSTPAPQSASTVIAGYLYVGHLAEQPLFSPEGPSHLAFPGWLRQRLALKTRPSDEVDSEGTQATQTPQAPKLGVTAAEIPP